MAKKRTSKAASSVAKKPKNAPQAPVEVLKDVEFLEHYTIKAMAQDIRDENKFNNLVPLLDQFELAKKLLSQGPSSEARYVCNILIESLSVVFEWFLLHGTMKKTKDEKKNLIAAWLAEKFDKFRANLLWLINSRLPENATGTQKAAMESYLEIVKQYTEYNREFPLDIYQDFVHALLTSSVGVGNRNHLVYNFFTIFIEHEDLQVNFFRESLAKKFGEWKSLEGPTKDRIFENFYTIIQEGVMFEDGERSGHNFTTAPQMDKSYMRTFKQDFQSCILAWVRMPDLSAEQYKKLLNCLHYGILPYMSSPTSLMDFLTDSLDQEEDEIVPLLVINSLWELMKRENLEYPEFFTKLYSLLTPSLLYTRYRARFFRLLDLFLSSTHLSANLVASFIKRIARLAMSSSAPGVVIVFPFIYNLLKRHPSCMIMLQNPDGKNNLNYKDPFKNDEPNPQKTGAIGSSLWELETLQTHYHPNIATLAKIFSEPFRKPNYNMEDFLDWTYKSLLDSEEKRKYKGLAALEYEDWESLFGKENAFMEGWELK
ncbi:hypothetical protein C7M61_000955 [Candidozyma pseudohaemuli]|uniref:CCAAT-binding factor domain-containing protein n=1 Tax=Candidozyma pseudohaemuli TaxID=418784 RepID=A0A2P7YZ94_9ASCO|nr:hypothetical protein C7M61_000955 [[Candida] pseudohaemulonii]PSK41278.1 hypothetical protein C7M61_000955 [[Candida] pseudohaemulonii]